MTAVLQDLKDFTKAVFGVWELLALTLGPILLWTVGRVFNAVPPPWLVWGYIAICLAIAMFYAWRAERRLAANATRENSPALRMRILRRIVGEAHATDGRKATTVTVIARIYNDGAPSIAEDFELEATVPSEGRKLVGIRVSPPLVETMEFPDPDGTVIQKIATADWLEAKTASPIPRDGKQEGFLIFRFPFDEFELLSSPRVVWRLIARDAQGRESAVVPTDLRPSKQSMNYGGMTRT